jgi:hypothetical protein
MLLASGLFPCRYESIFWYTGRMQSKGDLLRMKIHAHNSVFEEVRGVIISGTCLLPLVYATGCILCGVR